MKVLHFTTWREKCGIAGYAEGMVNALNALNVINDVYPLDRRHRKYMTPAEIRKDLMRLCCKAEAYDVVHIQHEFGFFADSRGKLGTSIANFHEVLKQLHRIRRPVVVNFHSEPDFISPLSSLLARRGHRARLQNYLLTRAWRRKIAPFFREGRTNAWALTNTRRSRVVFVNSGFAPSRTVPVAHGMGARNRILLSLEKPEAKERLGYPRDAILLSLFGFIAPYKGHDTAVRALRYLPPNFHLAIVGDLHPESRGNRGLNRVLAASRNSRKLAGRVRVTGYAEPQTVDLYHAATDFCLAPYHDETLSGSAGITWALSSGKPVIASKIHSFCEINDYADCLLLFTDRCAHELAWQVLRLAADPYLAEGLVARARRYMNENTWAHNAAKVLDIYERLLRRSHGRRTSLAKAA